MNERIRYAWEKAAQAHNGDSWAKQTAFLEKFAELIITECTQLLFAESERLYAYSSECDIMSRSEDAELCAEKCMDNILMIEQHFGVEK